MQDSGRQFGPYILEAQIGHGGMGTVWRARHERLGRRAAVKRIGGAVVGMGESSGVRAERFEREARATAGLRSPHTVEVFDFGTTPRGAFWYAMELLEGIDLQTLVRTFGPLSPARTVWVLRQICTSLAEAHVAGLLHRDIKPANVFLCQLGVQRDFVKVLDFGLVKAIDAGDSQLTATQTVPGSPPFIAPELISGGQVDGRADLYSLGCLAWWALTGALVFAHKEGAVQHLMAHVSDAPPAVMPSPEPVPQALEALVRRCLAKDPNDRFKDALELAAALDALPIEPAWSDAQASAWWRTHAPIKAMPAEVPLAHEVVELQPQREAALSELEAHFQRSQMVPVEFERRAKAVNLAESPGAIAAVLDDLPPLPVAKDHPPPAVIPQNQQIAHLQNNMLAQVETMLGSRRRMVGIFGEARRAGAWQPARLNQGLALFGGVKLDFTQVALPAGETRVQLLALFGGAEIRVPKSLPVIVDGIGIFGSFGQRGAGAQPSLDPSQPYLRVSGAAIFGGVEVQVVDPDKPGFWERLLGSE